MSRRRIALFIAHFILTFALVALPAAAAGYRLVGWSELGMHCMDSDYSLMAILPPYNTIHAQLIDPSGKLVRSAGTFTVTYQAVADASGSINRTSAQKTNFFSYAQLLFGANLAVDAGLAGKNMPGSANTPQAMTFDATTARFDAEGIPLTPTDDAGKVNPFPMMRLTARDGNGTTLATTDISLPVSDEVSCLMCHASGTHPSARPNNGWVNDPSPQRDVRLNILKLHDDFQSQNPAFQAAATAVGYQSAGLLPTATQGMPILCARCHGSNALGANGVAGIPPMTRVMHGGHENVVNLLTGQTLGEATTRDACYLCHPGRSTRCLRDAMGSAGTTDGAYSMDCQKCHGQLADLASSTRRGWLDEPSCGNCHTGTAVSNSGQLRYETVFDSPGHQRVPSNSTFTTNADAPVSGSSLFRASRGHGGVFCPACHGAPHAIVPSRDASDNAQNIAMTGSPGVVGDCVPCHGSDPSTTTGGPHGLHPVGQSWVRSHEHAGKSGCANCHGADLHGGPLSAMLADRSLSTEFGTKSWWRGLQVGCYSCHNGPDSENASKNHAPAVNSLTIETREGVAGTAVIVASDSDGNALAYRIVGKPKHGSAGIRGTTVTYTPDPGYSGSDSFTIAARDGSIDSGLATASVNILNNARMRPVRPR